MAPTRAGFRMLATTAVLAAVCTLLTFASCHDRFLREVASADRAQRFGSTTEALTTYHRAFYQFIWGAPIAPSEEPATQTRIESARRLSGWSLANVVFVPAPRQTTAAKFAVDLLVLVLVSALGIVLSRVLSAAMCRRHIERRAPWISTQHELARSLAERIARSAPWFFVALTPIGASVAWYLTSLPPSAKSFTPAAFIPTAPAVVLAVAIGCAGCGFLQMARTRLAVGSIRRRMPAEDCGRCSRCGHALDSRPRLGEASVCPECGFTAASTPHHPPPPSPDVVRRAVPRRVWVYLTLLAGFLVFSGYYRFGRDGVRDGVRDVLGRLITRTWNSPVAPLFRLSHEDAVIWPWNAAGRWIRWDGPSGGDMIVLHRVPDPDSPRNRRVAWGWAWRPRGADGDPADWQFHVHVLDFQSAGPLFPVLASPAQGLVFSSYLDLTALDVTAKYLAPASLYGRPSRLEPIAEQTDLVRVRDRLAARLESELQRHPPPRDPPAAP